MVSVQVLNQDNDVQAERKNYRMNLSIVAVINLHSPVSGIVERQPLQDLPAVE